MATKKFSPVRTSASSEEAAVSQALLLVGASADEVSIEVLDRSATRVTVRVSPRSEDAPVAQTPSASVESAPAFIESLDPEALQTADELSDDKEAENVEEITLPSDVEPAQDEEAPSPQTEVAPVEAVDEEPIDDETRERARLLAQELLDRMGLDARAEFQPLDVGNARSSVQLQIGGEDVGILIGKHGATLQSFQYMLNLMLNNDLPEGERSTRVTVDAGGYRQRRAGALEGIARDAASRAKRDRRSVRLEPMPAYERRLVHMALQNDGTVQTSSEGAEPSRYVVVSPAGESGSRDDRSFGENRGRGGFGGFNGRSGPGGGRRGGRNGR